MQNADINIQIASYATEFECWLQTKVENMFWKHLTIVSDVKLLFNAWGVKNLLKIVLASKEFYSADDFWQKFGRHFRKLTLLLAEE